MDFTVDAWYRLLVLKGDHMSMLPKVRYIGHIGPAGVWWEDSDDAPMTLNHIVRQFQDEDGNEFLVSDQAIFDVNQVGP